MTAFHNVCRWAAGLCLYSMIVAPSGLAEEGASQLSVIDGGVQRSEDAPYAPRDFEFLPGEFVYFTFHIAGFATKTNETTQVKSLQLEYEVTPQDATHVPLAESIKDKITADLSSEDKNWTPKRRASFLLPSYVAAGSFSVHVAVRDLIAKTESARDYPFQIGGVRIDAATSIQAQNFEFLRSQEDAAGLEVPAYAPGDTVWGRFQMIGFKHEAGNKYKLSYGIRVVRPDGKTFLDEPKAAQIGSESFYPAQFVPGELQISTPKNAARGSYVLTLTVRDLAASQIFELQRSFSIE